MKEFMKKTMGIDVNNFDLDLSHKKNQLFMTLSFYPTIEMVWTSKDEFESWSFSNTYVRFSRNEKGKVVGLRLHFDEENYVEAERKNYR
jgi:hypothetical protein